MQTHPTGHNVTPTFWSFRLVYVTSYLMTVVLFAAYSATFVSFLTARPYRLPFTDFQGLLNNGKYKLGIQFGSTNQNYFQVIIFIVNYILTIICYYVHILLSCVAFIMHLSLLSVTASYSAVFFQIPSCYAFTKV